MGGQAAELAEQQVELLETYKGTKENPQIQLITDLSFAADGKGLWATDSKTGALLLLDAGKIQATPLAGVGKLFTNNAISGLAITDQGQRVLVNAGERRIVLLDKAGNKIHLFGEKGAAPGMLSTPQGIAYSVNQRIYVADSGNDRVSVFSTSGVYLYSIGDQVADKTQLLSKPTHVGVDLLERVYVLESGTTPRISVYKDNGELLKRYDALALKKLIDDKLSITALTVDPAGRLFFVNSAAGKIVELDWEQGKVVFSFGSRGDGPGQYQEVSALTIKDDRMAVADNDLRKIDVYQLSKSNVETPARAWLSSMGKVDFVVADCTSGLLLNDLSVLCLNTRTNQVRVLNAQGAETKVLVTKFKKPTHATFDEEDIAVLHSAKVSVFSLAGQLKTEFGESGSSEGQLGGASDIYLRQRKIYVAEADAHRVSIFSKKGVFLNAVPAVYNKEKPILIEPAAVAVDMNGNIYVADNGKGKIVVFSNKLDYLYEIGEARESKSPAAFEEIIDLAIDADNNLYALAKTAANPLAVHVYSGPTKLFQFGAISETKNGLQEGVALSVSLSNKTVVGIFDVGDKKRIGVITYNYLQVPPRVGGLEVAGGVKKAKINWQRAAGSYVAKFRVYSAEDKDGEYSLIKETDDTELVVQHKTGEPALSFYKVAAVSGFDTEGPLSFAREDVFQGAYKAYSKGEFAAAEKILFADLQSNPNQPESHRYLGLTYQAQGRYGLAVQEFARLAETPEFRIEGINLQANALYANKDYAEAMALIQGLIKGKGQTGNVDAYLQCGKLSLKIGDAIGAINCLESGLRLAPKNAQINFVLGEAYIAVGAKDKGLAQFDSALQLAPDDAALWAQAGETLLDLAQYEIARQKFQKALTLNADNINAQLGIARSLVKLNKMAEAKNIAIKLGGEPETSSEGNYLLGLIELDGGRFGEAVIALGKSTREKPSNVGAWLALADAYVGMKKDSDARKALISAVEADPASFAAQQRLGLLSLALKEYESAYDALSAAVRLNPADAKTQVAATQAALGFGKLNAAADFANAAIKLDGKNVDVLVLAGEVGRARGKTGEAIQYLKSAIILKPQNASLYLMLGDLYLDNNLYDEAKVNLEKASSLNKTDDRAYVSLGKLYGARRLFNESISALESAVKYNPSSENKVLLDAAYAGKKKSLEFSSNAPQVALEDLRLQPIFSAAYKQYADKSVGTVKLRNVSATDFGNLTVSFTIKGYMDFPTSVTVEKLAANSIQEVSLKAALNNKVLDIDEDTGVQVEVKLSFVRDGQNDSVSITQPMTLYGKNAIVWKELNMVGSFVTPKDDSLRDFVRRGVNEFKPARGPLNDNLITSMTVFGLFNAHGLRYVVDPNNPFSSVKEEQIDYVQFPRESLKLKSGDCDDLSVLFSASLENFGIETAILDAPGHVFMMFNTGVAPANRDLISTDEDLLVIYNNQVWIPLETTMVATSFAESWAEGAKKFKNFDAKKQLTIIPLKQAWQTYQPVTLAKTDYVEALPEAERAKAILERERRMLLEKSLERLVRPFEMLVVNNPKDSTAALQVGIIYAKYGLYDKAIESLDKLLERDPGSSAVYNNRGNIFYQKGDFERAVEAYSQAEQLDPSDGGIKLNLALSAYRQGDMSAARDKYRAATKINQQVAKEYSSFGKLLGI
ncbi:MAG: tetratricopeptide repeat protein [Gammaproteobacteria bacterium]|nr:tetratricopeptide repeat protein [Gammaproteobacteria bacterium]